MMFGSQAAELHVCGDGSAVRVRRAAIGDTHSRMRAQVGVMREMCAATGDGFEIVQYERMTPLVVGEPLGSFEGIQRGDCVVAFNRKVCVCVCVWRGRGLM